MTTIELAKALKRNRLRFGKADTAEFLEIIKGELTDTEHRQRILMYMLGQLDNGKITEVDALEVTEGYPTLHSELASAVTVGTREAAELLFVIQQRAVGSYSKEYVADGLDTFMTGEHSVEEIEAVLSYGCRHMLDVDIQEKVLKLMVRCVETGIMVEDQMLDLLNKYFPILIERSNKRGPLGGAYNVYNARSKILVDFAKMGTEWTNTFFAASLEERKKILEAYEPE